VKNKRKHLVRRRHWIYQQNLSLNVGNTLIQSHEELIYVLSLMLGLQNLHSTACAMRKWLMIVKVIGSAPSGYVDFKFISLPLAIVRIDCTIVRVIEPQRLLVVLRNGILKSVFNLT
jgi:hypothetical protein